ncbi:MAG: hypothetical protein ABI542_08175 [Gemmatimonadota bacterium]
MLLLAVLLVGCEHSMPPSGVSDRWTGPWRDGDPAQLTAFQVRMIGLSADGAQVVFTVRRGTPVTGPNGTHSPQDGYDGCLGLLPATGGSGTFLACDDRSGQQDSLNVILAAAVDAEGQLLQEINVGPIDGYSPVREHVELYLGSTHDRAVRRRLMTLYHDVNGQLTVPPGSLNWLTDLVWLGPNQFAAIGYYAPAALQPSLNYLGIVVGQIGPDSATTTLVTSRPRPSQIVRGPEGTTLLVYTSGEVIAMAPTGEDRWVVRIPLTPGASLIGAGCHPGGCLAVTEEATPGLLTRWQFDPGGEPTPGASSQANGPVGRLWVSARDGALIFPTGGGLYRFD